MSRKSRSQRSLLHELSIRNIGVIDNALVEFKPGLNVITGETGAGKTMLLTALSLILGGKADSDLIRSGQERLVASGTFGISEMPASQIHQILEDNSIDLENGQVLLNRTVSKDGKSRAVVNGISTTASALTSISAELIEIHGQHANLILAKGGKQREILDAFAGQALDVALVQYQEKLHSYHLISSQISELKSSIRQRDALIAELQEIDKEFSKLKPSPTEISALDNQISKLESVEDLRVGAAGALDALNNEEQGGLNALHQAKRFLQQAKGKDAHLDKLHERLNEALLNLMDVASDLDRYVESLSADPVALESALSRRSQLLAFAKKYGQSSNREEALREAVERGDSARTLIADLTGGDERIGELEKQAKEIRKSLREKAEVLSEIRRKSAVSLSQKVENELHHLAMPKAKVGIVITSKSGDSDSDFQSHGLDDSVFKFSAHGGDELLPVTKAASGGELSRLMLGIQVSVASSYPVGTYVFDEVDAGVGGKAALEVGRRLKELAKESQVIVVTHLAQVAIWADQHIVVEKNSDGEVTESTIRAIVDNDREREIARMLSGVEESEHAQEHARELLNLRISSKA